MTTPIVDVNIIRQLGLSREIIGELGSMIMDWDGEILSGTHRKQAGWQKKHKVDSRELAKEWQVTPSFAKDMIRLHANIQRRPSREETRDLLCRMALELKNMGVSEEKVAAELAKRVPYTDRYVRELLPDKYKMDSKTRFAEPVPQTDDENIEEESGVAESTDPTIEEHGPSMEENVEIESASPIEEEPETEEEFGERFGKIFIGHFDNLLKKDFPMFIDHMSCDDDCHTCVMKKACDAFLEKFVTVLQKQLPICMKKKLENLNKAVY